MYFFDICIVITIVLLHLLLIHSISGKKKTSPIFIIIGIGATLGLFAISDDSLHHWDEKYHALVAKNLISDPTVPRLYREELVHLDSYSWLNCGVWLHKPPFTLYLISGSLSLFGVTEVAVRIPSYILFLCCIYLVFCTGKIAYSRTVGLFAAYLYAISGAVIEFMSGRVGTDHVDSIFQALMLCAVYLILRYYKNRNYLLAILLGLISGLAFLTKWAPAGMILLLLLLTQIYRYKRLVIGDVVVYSLASMVIATPVFYYFAHYFPMEFGFEQRYNLLHIYSVVEGHANGILYYVHKIRMTVNEIVYIPIIFLIYKVFRGKGSFYDITFLFYLLFPLILFSFFKTKMAGYLLFTYPIYFVIISDFAINRIGNAYSGMVQKMFIALVFLLAARYSIERLKLFQSNNEGENLKRSLAVLEFPDSTIIFNNKFYVETMFYTDYLSYDFIPSEEALDSLRDSGYTSIILLNQGIPSDMFKHYELHD